MTTVVDASLGRMQSAFERVGEKAGANDSLLIYYVGRSSCESGGREGHWLPVDAERDAPETWFSTTAFSESMRTLAARHVLVVVDGCYARRLLRGGAPGTRDEDYFAGLARKRARVVLTSGAEPQQTKDGVSLLAGAFAGVLRENRGVLEGDAVYALVRNRVREESTQPVEYSDIRSAGNQGGDFLFVPARSAAR